MLEEVSEAGLLLAREQHYIDSLQPTLNICPVAGNALGVIRTAEFREKISRSKKGLKHSPEANALKSIRQKGWQNALGYQHTPDARERISRNNPKTHPVCQCDLEGRLIKEWPSIKLAAAELNLHYQSISACLKGRLNQTGGYRWKSQKHEFNTE